MASILITGCRGGIGLDVACRLLKRGHKVYATVHRETSVNDVRSALNSFGENFVVDKLDVTDASDVNKVDDRDIDVLINNAAIGDSGPLAEIDPQRVKAVFETNVFSTLRLTQKVVPKLIAKAAGRIIFVGSMAGVIPTPFYAPYAMTKFALESVAFSLRTELKPFGIKVIIINPGGYNTGFNEKFMAQKYERMNADSLYRDYMGYVRQEEERVIKRELPRDTKFLGVGVRIQAFDPTDSREIALINQLQDQFIIKAKSADPQPAFKWDAESLNAQRAQYEKKAADYSSWKGMMGPRGKVDEEICHLACAAAWGSSRHGTPPTCTTTAATPPMSAIAPPTRSRRMALSGRSPSTAPMAT